MVKYIHSLYPTQYVKYTNFCDSCYTVVALRIIFNMVDSVVTIPPCAFVVNSVLSATHPSVGYVEKQ